MRVLVTGGAGFIGSAVCRHAVGNLGWRVVNLDKLTYAGNVASLGEIAGSSRYRFVHGDIGDERLVADLLAAERIEAIINLAAETHVDRSIDGPNEFFSTNVMGTLALLQATTRYWNGLATPERDRFRFHHVSTDEVFGDLPLDGGRFTERSPYRPSSPYSASKAASDHMVGAWHRTYGLPVTLSNCSNNYGPYHHPEKLIPRMIIAAIQGRPLPVYGNGGNVRDWLFVNDHAAAIAKIVSNGRIGESYNVGGDAERSNLAVVHEICSILDRLAPDVSGSYARLISFVPDRPGHDLRYAIDGTKLQAELNWQATTSFEDGLGTTVRWYLANRSWWVPLVQTP